MKQKMKIAMEEARHDGLEKAAELLKSTNHSWKEKVEQKNYCCIFLIFLLLADLFLFYLCLLFKYT